MKLLNKIRIIRIILLDDEIGNIYDFISKYLTMKCELAYYKKLVKKNGL